MLSFKQLQEKKTKIKINPKKDEIVEGQKKKKDDSYLETNMKKRQANNEKARKDMEKMGTSMKNPHFESTNQEESAYDSQEEVSEESNQEIEAETEIPFLTFDQYQHVRTLDEEQLNEFLGKLFGGGSKPKESKPSASSAPPAKPPNALQGVMTSAGSSQGSRSMMGRAGQAGAPMSKPPTGRPSTKQAPKPMYQGGEKIKKEEVYRSFAHLTLTNTEFQKLCKIWSEETVIHVLDSIENYKHINHYKSLYLTARTCPSG